MIGALLQGEFFDIRGGTGNHQSAIIIADTNPDSDHDGIPNDQDQCPTLAETYNGIYDHDGCPEIDEQTCPGQ